MKKFPALIALVLALVMLVIPMGAMAEPTTATVIQLANPSVSFDGETRSMPGLALQLALCESADASLVQIIADVLVNNQNATSAMLQVDSAANIVALLGGMSNAYSVNMQEASAMALTGYGEMVNQIEELVYTLESWTLPDEIVTIISNHFSTFTVTESTGTNANGVEMQYVNVKGDVTNMIIDVMNAFENDALVKSFLQLIDPSMTTLGLVEGSGIGNGNGIRLDATVGTDVTGMINTLAADLTIYSNNVDSGIVRIAMDSDMSANAAIALTLSLVNMDGSEAGSVNFNVLGSDNGFSLTANGLMDGEGFKLASEFVTSDVIDTFTLTAEEVSEYADEPATVTAYFTNQKSDAGCAIDAKLTATSYGDTTTVALNGNYAVTDTGVTVNGKLTATDPYSGDTVIALNDLTIDAAAGLMNFDFSVTDPYSGTASVLLNGNYELTDTGIIITGNLNVTDSYGDSIALTLDKLSIDFMTGDFAVAVSYADAYSEPMSFALSLTSVEPVEGALYSALLSFSGDDGYSTVGATVDVHMFTADVDTASFYIDPMTAINLLTMDELQMQTAESELTAVMSNLGETIMNAYSDFFN